MSEQEAPIEAGQESEAAPAEIGQAKQFWFDSAPDEIKGYIQNKGWDDPIKAVTSYQELEKFRGASEDQLIKLPKGDEPWDNVWDKLGRPESPDKYELDLGEGTQIDDARFNMIKEVAHKAGLNPQQLQMLAEADSAYAHEFMENYKQEKIRQSENELADLEKQWGKKAFDERTELARRAVRRGMPEGADSDAMLNAIEDAIGSANMIKLFSNLAENSRSTEDKIPEGDGDRPFGYTKEQAAADKKALMFEIQADPSRLAAYNNGAGKDYEKMQSLLKRMS